MVDDADRGVKVSSPSSPATLPGVGSAGSHGDARSVDAGGEPSSAPGALPDSIVRELGDTEEMAMPLPAPTGVAARRSADGTGTLHLPSVSQRYRFGELIGIGGMGEVVLARDENIDREVAVKRLRSAAPSAEQLARFVREARVQGGLEHPAVVPVHDLGLDRDGRPFFVMKRLLGKTLLELLDHLRDQLRTAGDDDAAVRRRMLRAFVDVCLAVEFAHSRGIVHRDLKPANIMLGDFGEVYVLDWGVARAVDDDDPAPSDGEATPRASDRLKLESGDTQLGTVLGTPAYMAPEQLAGDRAGPAADIYALGCILFEIAAGEPWHATHRTVGKALSEPAARPSSRRPDVAPELDAACEHATQVEAEHRFGSARALGDAVQAYLDGDRDVAVREALAKQHIAEARAALAHGESDADRRAAIRAAGRALALDPTATEAAELVTRLLLEPPREIPEAVEQRLDRIDSDAVRHQGRIAAYAMLGYFAFVPFLLWTGVRDMRLLIAYVVLAAASAVQLHALARRAAVAPNGIYVNAIINAALIAVIVRLLGPFVITPSLAIVTMLAYAAHPRFGRMSILGLMLGAAVAVPWALEALGVLAATYSFTPAGELVIGSPNMQLSPAPVQLALAVLLFLLPTVVGLLSRVLASRQRDATRRLELQAWHLEQVVPSLGAR